MNFSSFFVSFVNPPQFCSADNPELEFDAIEASYFPAFSTDFYFSSPAVSQEETIGGWRRSAAKQYPLWPSVFKYHGINQRGKRHEG